MSKENDLSCTDKKLLDSFDISIFKSAVAYLQNSRHNSCQPKNYSESKSPSIQKSWQIKEKDPPLLPIESRNACLYKKYVSESYGFRKNIRKNFKPKLMDRNEIRIPGFKNLEVKGYGKMSPVLNNDIKLNDKIRYSSQLRKNSLPSPFGLEELSRINHIHIKIIDYEKSRARPELKEDNFEEEKNSGVKSNDFSA